MVNEKKTYAAALAALLTALVLVLGIGSCCALRAQLQEAEIAVLQEEIRRLEARPLTVELVREEPEDKPEWHIEATEPERIEPFDANTLPWNYDYVFRVIGAEARGEPMEGIMAVAQCILETASREGITPEEVVKRPGQYADPMPTAMFDGGETVNEAMLRVFACGERAVDDRIEFFCTSDCDSAWHRSLHYVTTIGGHDFFARWD